MKRGGSISFLAFFNTYVFAAALPVAVFGAGLFIGIKLKFFGKRRLKTVTHGIREAKSGEVSPFKAMSVALAGTLGVGNIAGVSAAISAGGAGAVFWMWISALFASVLKYSETLLAVKYRRKILENGKERNTGGAFVYMSESGHKRLALVFALLCVLTALSMGGIVQSNAMAVSLECGFGIPHEVSGAVFAILTFIVISGGFSKISDFTVYAIPLLCVLYSAVSLFIIAANITSVPAVFARIVSEAFSFKAAGGGVFGYAVFRAMRYGVARGILSNEAGSGTSVTAHAASDAKSPVEQGFFGILEVFVDTILLCSMTAFVILLAPEGAIGEAAMVAAIRAYSHFLGNIAPGFMSTSVTVFAFGTVICWSVYGAEALRFMVKDCFDRVKMTYFFVYSMCVFAGAIVSGGFMWELSDFTTAVMTLINTAFLIYSSNEIKKETFAYIETCHNKESAKI